MDNSTHNDQEQQATFKYLSWDSRRTKLNIYELLFLNEIQDSNIDYIRAKMRIADLVYIKNPTKYRRNSEFISTLENAVLYDTQIIYKYSAPFILDTRSLSKFNICSKISNFELDISHFKFSRFNNDTKLKMLGFDDVYSEWVKNSFNKKNKHFLYLHEYPESFILFSVEKSKVQIELIYVSPNFQHQGIGYKMIQSLLSYCNTSNIKFICVGTQIANTNASNLYIKSGFRLDESIDVYHYWLKK